MPADRNAEIIASYEAGVISGEVFHNAARAVRSQYGYEPPVGYRRHAAMLKVLAEGAALGERQAALIDPIIASTRGAACRYPREAVGQLYEAAVVALREPFFDVLLAASPEPGHPSASRKDWTLGDRLALLVTLHEAGRAIIPDTGIGWCLAALIKRESIRTLDGEPTTAT